MELRPLPLGTSDFERLRYAGKIYVDKTEMIHKLLGSEEKVLLSRPRRFGKSLLVSTFESLFKYGIRDFKGLAIESLWTDRFNYLVVRLDFSEIKQFDTLEQFRMGLSALLARGFGEVGFSFVPGELFSVYDQLSEWLRKLAAGSLVVLIDEYDAPLTSCLNTAELFEQVRTELSIFYSRIKSNDRALRFLFMTGIAKFSKASIFSELNTLTDISMLDEYATLLGYTREEVENYFGVYLDRASDALGMPRTVLMDRLAEQYDGFSFSKKPYDRDFLSPH